MSEELKNIVLVLESDLPSCLTGITIDVNEGQRMQILSTLIIEK